MISKRNKYLFVTGKLSIVFFGFLVTNAFAVSQISPVQLIASTLNDQIGANTIKEPDIDKGC
jgi:hypothetical protein